MDRPPLAVTGSTGALGGKVARGLAARGVPQRLLVRTPARAPDLAGADVLPCSHGDREAALAALEGVTTLFMVSAAESADRLDEHRVFVDAAAEAGVEQVVYTSFAGAAADRIFTLGRDHWATEEHLRASGMQHTFLRDSFYLDFLPLMVGDDEVIRGPAGDGRCRPRGQLSRREHRASRAAAGRPPTGSTTPGCRRTRRSRRVRSRP